MRNVTAITDLEVICFVKLQFAILQRKKMNVISGKQNIGIKY